MACNLASFACFRHPNSILTCVSRHTTFFMLSRCNSTETTAFEEEEFRKLDLYKKRGEKRKTVTGKLRTEMLPPRYKQMPVDQNWVDVWPAAQSFRPSVVPFPLWQGQPKKKDAPPGKFANAELMKIPNFLHLSPLAIKQHCNAIKKFCTPWPKGLETDESCHRHFPIEVITSDYCHSSPSIRDARARIVTLRMKLSVLELDYHARDKLLRLVGDRYDLETDILSIVADRCPLRKQNYDYTMYLLTALFYESWKYEPWEMEKTEADMEKFIWEESRAEAAVVDLIERTKQARDEENNIVQESPFSYLNDLPADCGYKEVASLPEVKKFGEALAELHDEGENEYTLQHYKEAACSLLGLVPPTGTVTVGEMLP